MSGSLNLTVSERTESVGTCRQCRVRTYMSYRFGDPVDMGILPSLNLLEFGNPRIDLGTPRIDLGTPLSIDINGCTAIDPIKIIINQLAIENKS